MSTNQGILCSFETPHFKITNSSYDLDFKNKKVQSPKLGVDKFFAPIRGSQNLAQALELTHLEHPTSPLIIGVDSGRLSGTQPQLSTPKYESQKRQKKQRICEGTTCAKWSMPFITLFGVVCICFQLGLLGHLFFLFENVCIDLINRCSPKFSS